MKKTLIYLPVNVIFDPFYSEKSRLKSPTFLKFTFFVIFSRNFFRPIFEVNFDLILAWILGQLNLRREVPSPNNVGHIFGVILKKSSVFNILRGNPTKIRTR